MQVKGIVKLFLVLLVFVVLLQYLYLFPTWKVERAADKYAQNIISSATTKEDKFELEKAAKSHYLDSMSSEVIFKIPLLADYTYDDLKKSQLALGLDLKGGMSVILQVNLKDFLLSLANYNKDATFRLALDNAEKAMSNSQDDFITLFYKEWQKVGKDKNLAKVFIHNRGLRNTLNIKSTDEEVLKLLRTKGNETIKQTYDMLKQRIDKLGVVQPNVSLDENRNLILVELPGIDNPERARNFLQASAKLEFWNVYRMSDPGIIDAFLAADKKLKKEMAKDSIVEEAAVKYDTIWNQQLDSLGNATGDSTMQLIERKDMFADLGPLLSKLTLYASTPQGADICVAGKVERNKKKAVMEMLNRPDIKSLFKKDIMFRWSMNPINNRETGEETNEYELYILKKEAGSELAPLEGDVVESARANVDNTTGKVEVSLSMNQVGAKKWAAMTTIAANDKNRQIAIVLDDEVVSAPNVNGPITGGMSSITGGYTMQEATDFSRILEIGKLPARPQIIQESTVGPSLGAENISRSINALLIGFGLVLLFMMLYYGGAGVVSIIALLLNIFFIFGVLASLGTVLTLPGIAGIVLTIGMAVDANVIIFERVKEELRLDKPLWTSIENGFKYSYSAIIDANVTTILVAILLAYFGLGPIKGFAVVLIIGVLLSLFTAVLVSKLIFEWWVKTKGKKISFWISISKNALANLNNNWMGKRKIAYSISGALIIISLISIFTRGFELGVDFKGGYAFNIEFNGVGDVDPQSVRNTLTDAFGSTPIVKAVDTKNTYNVVTSYLIQDNSEGATDRVIDKMFDGLSSVYTGMDKTEFKKEYAKDAIHITSSTKVGPTIADDITKSSFLAGIFALLAIFLYIFLRFTKWEYSLGAVVALFHDSLIVLGAFSLFHGVVPWSLEIDQAFIAALLTVIGYSINDTVVVFDRIREFLGIYREKPIDEIMNKSINSTFSRTLITSLTTFFVVLVLFLFGGSSIKGFAFALLIGIIVGTYSSIFVASPLVRDIAKDLKPKGKKSSFSRTKRN